MTNSVKESAFTEVLRLCRLSAFIAVFAVSAGVLTGCSIASADESVPANSGCFPMLLHMVHHNPGEPLFKTRLNDPGYIKELGYSGQIPKIQIQCGVTFDKAFPGILPEQSQERLWIERHAHSVRLMMDNARKQGMPIYPFLDMLVIPKPMMDKLGSKMKVNGRLSIMSETTEKVVRAQMEELFRRFPDIAGITLRHGETYLHDTPYHKGTSPVHTANEHAKLINILRDEICVKRNKTLIYRTWGFGRNNIHTNSKNYLAATNQVEPHPKLFFSTKHANADYIRGIPFNTTMDKGKHQRIVEVSVNQAGLFGDSSSPYYIAKGVIEGWDEMENPRGLRDFLKDSRIQGIWIWCYGDGWNGPYFNNELWMEVNEYVMRKYTLDPSKSEEVYFNQFATEELGLKGESLKKFRKLVMLATEASFIGQYTRVIRPWRGLEWWCRDHGIASFNVDPMVIKGKIQEAMEEKAKAVKMWKMAEAISKTVSLKDTRDTKFMRVSTTYGRIKYQVFEQVWKIELMLADERLNKKTADKAALITAVKEYDKLFKEWRQLKRDNVCCPTLYFDNQADYGVKYGRAFGPVLQKLKKRLGLDK